MGKEKKLFAVFDVLQLGFVYVEVFEVAVFVYQKWSGVDHFI